MGLVPCTGIPYKIVHDGVTYEGSILPFKDRGKPFPEEFHIMWGLRMFADIRYGQDGWEAFRIWPCADPAMIQEFGEFIQAHYDSASPGDEMGAQRFTMYPQ